MIFRLGEHLIFPDPAMADEDGLLAVGGDLSAPRLLLAYRQGIFPWYGNDTPILWYAPKKRFVLYPAELKVSKSMRRTMRSGRFTITVNQCFADIIKNCSSAFRKDQPGTWITDDMIAAYIGLHRMGYAHSVETWEHGLLVGGLYGVQVGCIFCGESMFSKTSDASKAALICLCECGRYDLIDCQVHTGHLASLGARMIDNPVYLQLLQQQPEP